MDTKSGPKLVKKFQTARKMMKSVAYSRAKLQPRPSDPDFHGTDGADDDFGGTTSLAVERKLEDWDLNTEVLEKFTAVVGLLEGCTAYLAGNSFQIGAQCHVTCAMIASELAMQFMVEMQSEESTATATEVIRKVVSS